MVDIPIETSLAAKALFEDSRTTHLSAKNVPHELLSHFNCHKIKTGIAPTYINRKKEPITTS